jgi:hypothetical protein
MWTEKDSKFLDRLLESTKVGKTDWAPTANTKTFTTSLSGKFSISVGGSGENDGWLTIHDANGTRIHYLSSDDFNQLPELYQLARRRALKVDEAIDELMKDLGEES